MATAQLTASSISTRNLPSFQGLRSSAVKVGPSVGHLRVGSGLSQRAVRGLVVKAATVVTPKVLFSPLISVFDLSVLFLLVL
jgi:chaperonin GroES